MRCWTWAPCQWSNQWLLLGSVLSESGIDQSDSIVTRLGSHQISACTVSHFASMNGSGEVFQGLKMRIHLRKRSQENYPKQPDVAKDNATCLLTVYRLHRHHIWKFVVKNMLYTFGYRNESLHTPLSAHTWHQMAKKLRFLFCRQRQHKHGIYWRWRACHRTVACQRGRSEMILILCSAAE